jgi:glycosyltransferase involved in cell wall biosynthesis
MGNRAIIISRGLHPPWNMGEVVLARNFVNILAKLYDNMSVFSTVDERRGPMDSSDSELRFQTKYYRDELELRVVVSSELSIRSQADVHLINASLTRFFSLLRKAKRLFLYQFVYNIFNDPKLIARSTGALPLTYLGNVRVLTTALSPYGRLRKIFMRRYYYVPAPIGAPSYSGESVTADRSRNGLKVLYLGHGSYLRFPYDKVLKAILRLKREGCGVEFNVYISKLGYANYVKFERSLKRMVNKLNLGDLVKLYLGNLSEAKKWNVIRENDVVLFPSLINAAVDPPLVVLETMFMGKCVIATSIQSIPYLLGENRGIIVNRWNLEKDIYEALKILNSNRELLKEYGISSRKWAAKIHSMDAVYNKMREILGET